jgi:hypothetical protein
MVQFFVALNGRQLGRKRPVVAAPTYLLSQTVDSFARSDL